MDLEVDKDVTMLALGHPDMRYQAPLLMGTAQAVIASVDGTGFLEPKGFHSVASAGKYPTIQRSHEISACGA
jgi:hypothetical protein